MLLSSIACSGFLEETGVIHHAPIAEGIGLDDIRIAAFTLALDGHGRIVCVNDLKISATRAANAVARIYAHNCFPLFLSCELSECSDAFPCHVARGRRMTERKSARNKKRPARVGQILEEAGETDHNRTVRTRRAASLGARVVVRDDIRFQFGAMKPAGFRWMLAWRLNR